MSSPFGFNPTSSVSLGDMENAIETCNENNIILKSKKVDSKNIDDKFKIDYAVFIQPSYNNEDKAEKVEPKIKEDNELKPKLEQTEQKEKIEPKIEENKTEKVEPKIEEDNELKARLEQAEQKIKELQAQAEKELAAKQAENERIAQEQKQRLEAAEKLAQEMKAKAEEAERLALERQQKAEEAERLAREKQLKLAQEIEEARAQAIKESEERRLEGERKLREIEALNRAKEEEIQRIKIEQAQQRQRELQDQFNTIKQARIETPKIKDDKEEKLKELRRLQELKREKEARKQQEVKTNTNNSFDYSVLDEKALFGEVKKYAIKHGKAKSVIDRKWLNEKFGKGNIDKLITKSYLIPFGSKGVTFGNV